MNVKYFFFLVFDTSARGPAAVLEIRDPLREPNVATKLRQELQHPLWVLTLFVLKMDRFWGAGLGYRGFGLLPLPLAN